MNELDLLVENYFTDSFETSDLFRLVEQVMNEEIANKGNVLEGIVAAALGSMFAKGADISGRKRTGGMTSISDILDMIGNLSGGSELVQYSDTLMSGDILKIVVELKENEIQELLNIPTSIELQVRYKNELKLSQQYANEKRFRKFANRIARGQAYRDEGETKPDTIEVRAMGKAGQGTTTADVQILVNDMQPPAFGPGISLKGMSKQFAQSVVTLSGTGAEVGNFKKGLDKDVGRLKELAPTEYDTFKNNVANLMKPIVGSKAVSGSDRQDVYAALDALIGSSGIPGVSNISEWLNKSRDELAIFLKAVASSSNKNPKAFAQAVEPLIRGAVGDVEFAQMARGLTRGRMEPLEGSLQRLMSKGGEFDVKSDPGGIGEVSLTLAGAPLLSFRFRRDASKSASGYKFTLRLLVQSTSEFQKLLAFGGASA